MRYHKILGVAGLTISLALTGCGQEDIIADTAYPLQEHLEGLALLTPVYERRADPFRSEEHTSELQSQR